jgi:hypothetical protein
LRAYQRDELASKAPERIFDDQDVASVELNRGSLSSNPTRSKINTDDETMT